MLLNFRELLNFKCLICLLQHVAKVLPKVKVAHQVWTALLHVSFLWEADVNVEELCKVAKEHAVDGGWGGAQEELFGGKQLGDGVQVLERHLPDLRFCVPSNPLQVRPETVFAFCWNLKCQRESCCDCISHLTLVMVG